MTIQSYKLGPGTLKLNVVRTATIATTNTSTTITATSPTFISGDVGVPISGAGIPVGATIASVQSPTSATLSAAATATGTPAATITPAAVTDASCQVKSCKVSATEIVTTADAQDMLCGEQLPAEDTVTGYTWAIAANLLQDISTGGFIAFTWTNKGKVVWAEFIPNIALGKKVTGPVRVVPLEIGGDVNSRPTHDLQWVMPTVTPAFA